MEKKTGIIKKYPILVGFCMIFILLLIVVGYRKHQDSRIFEEKYLSESIARKSTVEGFTNPEDLVKYLLYAVSEGDSDKFLRGCAIDEITMNMDTEEFIESTGEFDVKTTCLPARFYTVYAPLVSMEWADKYAQIYEKFIQQRELKNPVDLEIKEIGFVNPEKQLENSYKVLTQKKAETWGASTFCEMYALYKTENKEYITFFTLAEYFGYWKLFSLESELAGTDADSLIYEDTNIIKGLKTKDGSEEELREYFESFKEKNTDKEIKETKWKKNALLPANCLLINTVYGNSPEEVIEDFVLLLQKQMPASAMAYASRLEQLLAENKSELKIIQSQREFASQLQNFYYGLLEIKGKKNSQSLTDLGLTASQIVEKANPRNIPYMDLMGITEKKKVKEDVSEYLAVYRYGGKYYLAGFTVQRYEKGWQIVSMSAESEKLKDGAVREITQKEMDKLLRLK